LIGLPKDAALAALIASTMDIARGGGPDAAGAGLMIDPADSIVRGLIEAAGFLISVILGSSGAWRRIRVREMQPQN
jgi:hypothetical protein